MRNLFLDRGLLVPTMGPEGSRAGEHLAGLVIGFVDTHGAVGAGDGEATVLELDATILDDPAQSLRARGRGHV